MFQFDGDGDLPEVKRVGSNVIEFGLLLVLDHFLEGADSFCVRDLHRKVTLGFIAEYPVVELECGRHLTTVQ
jgi:hypothetical protein